MTTHSDILIIGGGIAGLSAGAQLAPHARVTLLEAEDALAYHSSGRSMAIYEASYGESSTIALARASGDFYHGSDYLSPRGLMVVAKPGEDQAFEADLADMSLDEISVAEAQAIVPILDAGKITRAGYHAAAWDIDADRLLQDNAKAIRAQGGQVLTKSKISAITWDGVWHVDAGGLRLTADVLVNAAGSWGDQIAAMAGVAPIGLTPCRRSVARIPTPGDHDPSNWPIFFGVAESWYARPDAGALSVSPAEEDPTTPHDAWAEDMVLAEGIDRFQSVITPPVTRMLSNWAGLRTFSPDRSLVIGHDPDAPSFFWLVGQGGYGFLTSPAAGQTAADLILGKPPALDAGTLTALSPKRFRI